MGRTELCTGIRTEIRTARFTHSDMKNKDQHQVRTEVCTDMCTGCCTGQSAQNFSAQAVCTENRTGNKTNLVKLLNTFIDN